MRRQINPPVEIIAIFVALLASARQPGTASRPLAGAMAFAFPSLKNQRSHHFTTKNLGFWGRSSSFLFSGRGCGDQYTWDEDDLELELSVLVPPETKSKDLKYQATSKSISLEIIRPAGEENIVLVDPTRKLRGRVLVDGTFWVLGEVEHAAERLPFGRLPWMPPGTNATDLDPTDYREVTITIEKSVRTPRSEHDVVDYDWKGFYSGDNGTNVIYDAAEKLDIREYAAGLGVDIDNLNMSLVDKSMFSSGLNLTTQTLDALKDAGYVKEVTQQADGSEWVDDPEGGDGPVPFSPLGEGIHKDELRTSTIASGTKKKASNKIPFLDTDSPWHTTIPVDKKDEVAAQLSKNPPESKSDEDKAKKREEAKKTVAKRRTERAADPIDALTVKRLKEILRAQGLPLSGNKATLQERLRGHVQSIAGGKKEPSVTAAAAAAAAAAEEV